MIPVTTTICIPAITVFWYCFTHSSWEILLLLLPHIRFGVYLSRGFLFSPNFRIASLSSTLDLYSGSTHSFAIFSSFTTQSLVARICTVLVGDLSVALAHHIHRRRKSTETVQVDYLPRRGEKTIFAFLSPLLNVILVGL